MSFPRYPAYKPSDVEWLGEVPEHWEVKRIASLYREVVEQGSDELPVLSVSIHHGVSDSELSEEEMDRKVTRSEDRSKYKRVTPGDLVYNMMRAWQGAFGTVCVEGMVSPAYVVARPTSNVPSTWIEYLLRTDPAINEIKRFSRGITDFRLRLYWDEFKNLRVCLPPSNERDALIGFLDRETTKIDALIAEQQRLIELLQEKRQAVISHAVTKGLNPDAPMKDSGVDWLGEVPEHWRVVPLKNLVESGTSISYGIVQPGEPLEDGVPFVQTTNMTRGEFSLEALQKTSVHIASAYPRSELAGGEVLLGIRASIGAAHVAPIWLNGANLSRGVARIAPSPQIKNDFLVYYLRSEATMKYWLLAKQGSTFNEVSIETVKNLRVCVPESEEQREIADYVRHSEARHEAALTQSSSLITLLQERRSALISAAVTGQIDVRGLVPETEVA